MILGLRTRGMMEKAEMYFLELQNVIANTIPWDEINALNCYYYLTQLAV